MTAALTTGGTVFRGAAAELWRMYGSRQMPAHVLLDGPAGTGKTIASLMLLDRACREYPGLRAFILRRTRVSMTESTLASLERHVLGPGHPALESSQASRALRREYRYPNGSIIVPLGLNNPSRLYSSDWDIGYINESIELTEEQFDSLQRGMRSFRMPWAQPIILDTNPAEETHWLNRRAGRPGSGMARLLSRLQDNPAYYSANGRVTEQGRLFLAGMRLLRGVMRDRMLLGRWVTAEGLIYDAFDPSVHVADAEQAPSRYRMFAASIDFGWRFPTAMVLQLWGIAGDWTAWLLGEHYAAGSAEHGLEWLAATLTHWHDQIGLAWAVADSAEPQTIDALNEHLTRRGRRRTGRIVRPAEKSDRMAGIALVNQLLATQRVRLVRDAQARTDPRLDAVGLPVNTVQEIGAYTWAKTPDGRPMREVPDPMAVDHGCDAMRYLLTELWARGVPQAMRMKPRPGTYGAFAPLPGERR